MNKEIKNNETLVKDFTNISITETVTDNSNLQSIVMSVDSNNIDEQLSALKNNRKLLSTKAKPPINELIHLGIIPILIRSLQQNSSPDLQFESISILIDICSDDLNQTTALLESGVVPTLTHLLRSNDQKLCEESVKALTLFIEYSPQLRNCFIESNILGPLLELLKCEIPLSVLRNISNTLSLICRNKDPPLSEEAIMRVIPALVYLINNTNIDILEDTLWAVAHITDKGCEVIQLVIDSGIVPNLVQFLSNEELQIKKASLRSVGNIVTGNDEQTQVVLNCNVLSYFPSLLTHSDKNIIKESVWMLSNICGGNKQQIESVFHSGLIPMVIYLLPNGEYQVKKEAAFSVNNLITNANKFQTFYLIEKGVIEHLCELLSTSQFNEDYNLLTTVLEGLNNFLKNSETEFQTVVKEIEKCGGIESIESLQNHSDERIYYLAFNILNEYFDTDEQDEMMT